LALWLDNLFNLAKHKKTNTFQVISYRMKKTIPFLLLLNTFSIFCFSQETKEKKVYFKLNYDCLLNESPFTKVQVLDKRESGQFLGFIQSGLFNRIVEVDYAGSIMDGISKFFLAKDVAEKKQQEAVLILSEFYLNQYSTDTRERGRFKLLLRLFTKTDENRYREIVQVDSAFVCEGLDATDKLFRSITEQLCGIAKNAFVQQVHQNDSLPSYTLEELSYVDSLEKMKIPIYTAEKINAGIFTTYEQFKQNKPDTATITIDTSDASKTEVYYWHVKKEKNKKIDNLKVYAICDGKTLMKATSIGFYEMQRHGLDFYYVGQTSFSNSFNGSNSSGYLRSYGALGAVIDGLLTAFKKKEQAFLFKTNYLKGNSIVLAKASE
jgi:hypothetical protein